MLIIEIVCKAAEVLIFRENYESSQAWQIQDIARNDIKLFFSAMSRAREFGDVVVSTSVDTRRNGSVQYHR